jgi:hypothetical protein
LFACKRKIPDDFLAESPRRLSIADGKGSDGDGPAFRIVANAKRESAVTIGGILAGRQAAEWK